MWIEGSEIMWFETEQYLHERNVHDERLKQFMLKEFALNKPNNGMKIEEEKRKKQKEIFFWKASQKIKHKCKVNVLTEWVEKSEKQQQSKQTQWSGLKNKSDTFCTFYFASSFPGKLWMVKSRFLVLCLMT